MELKLNRKKTVKIIDNFLFRNEYDLLEIRLRTHYKHVDQFVIVESDHTFTGIYKGFNLPKQLERYAPWKDKIRYIQIGKPPHNDPWNSERWMRAHFQTQWDNMGKDDVAVVTDLDEIIRPEAFEFIKDTDYNFYRLGMPAFNFKFNYLILEGHYPWPLAKAFRGYVVQGMDGMRSVENVPGGRHVDLTHCGWHWSWFGNTEWGIEKLRSYSHTELDTPELGQSLDVDTRIKNNQEALGRPFACSSVKFDDYFPKSIIENLPDYKNYVLPDGEKSIQEHFPGDIVQILSEY